MAWAWFQIVNLSSNRALNAVKSAIVHSIHSLRLSSGEIPPNGIGMVVLTYVFVLNCGSGISSMPSGS